MNTSPIGFRRVNHVSWAVTELDLAVELYSKLLGAKVICESRLTDVKEVRINVAGRDYWTSVSDSFGIECLSISMLELLDGFKIELYHVENTSKSNVFLFHKKRTEQNCLSLEVDSIDRATKYLITLGFRVFEVTRSIEYSASNSFYQYFLDPWGNIFKLFEAT